MSRQIQPGDYIRLSTAEEGTVTDVTWRNTTMRSPSNDLVIVPNSVIGRAQITNFTAGDEEHTLALPFTVAFGSDLDAVKRVAEQGRPRGARQRSGCRQGASSRSAASARSAPRASAAVTIRVVRFQDRLPVVDDLVERLHPHSPSGVEFGTGVAAPASRQRPSAAGCCSPHRSAITRAMRSSGT